MAEVPPNATDAAAKPVARAMTLTASDPEYEDNPYKAAIMLTDVGNYVVRHQVDDSIRQYMKSIGQRSTVQRFFEIKFQEIKKNKQLLGIFNKIKLKFPDDLKEFDLSCCLNIYQYLLDGGSKRWRTYPSSSDQSVEANLYRLKLMRNEIFLKINNFQMPMPSLNDDEDEDDEEDPVELPLVPRLERILLSTAKEMDAKTVKELIRSARAKSVNQDVMDVKRDEMLRIMVNDKDTLESILNKMIEIFDSSTALSLEFRNDIEDFVKSRATIKDEQTVFSNIKDIFDTKGELIQLALKFGKDLKQSQQNIVNFKSSILKMELAIHIDRSDLFQELDKLLKKKNNIIIKGPLGSGKTNLLHDYGHRCKEEDYSSSYVVRWFNGVTRQSIWNDYRAISFELGLDYAIPKYILNNVIGKKLAKISKTILFLFDNVTNMDDLKEFRRYMPENVKFIVTTDQIQSFKEFDHAEFIMRPLSQQQCWSYMSSSKKLSSDQMAKFLAFIDADEAYYPYRLEKAAALFRLEKQWTLDHYQTMIQQKLNSTRFSSGLEAETHLLLDILKSNYSTAFEILNYCIYLDHDMISRELLEDSLKEKFSQQAIEDHLKFLVDLTLLNKFELLGSSGKCSLHQGFVLHSVIKCVVERRFLDSDRFQDQRQLEQQEIIINLTDVLSKRMPFIEKYDGETQEWEKAKMYYLSAANVVNVEIDIDKNEREAVSTDESDHESIDGKARWKTANDKAMRFDLFEKVINYNRTVFSDYVKSIDFLKADLELKLRFFKDKNQRSDHPEVFMAFNNIGLAYTKLNMNREAFKNILKALEIAERLSKYESKDNKRFVALANSNIGSIVKLRERVDKKELKNTQLELGLKHQQDALNYRLKVHKGFNHDDIATSYNNIGLTYQKMCNYKEAFKYLEKAIQMNIALYKNSNLKLALSISNLGNLQIQLGYYKSGIANLEKVARMYKTLYLVESVEEALTLNNIGSAYLKLKNMDKALEYLEASLRIYENLNKGNNLLRATLLNNCGRLYYERDDLVKAIDYLERSASMKKQPDMMKQNWTFSYIGSIGDTYHQLANICAETKEPENLEKAMIYWKCASQIYELIEESDMVKQIKKQQTKAEKNKKWKERVKENSCIFSRSSDE